MLGLAMLLALSACGGGGGGGSPAAVAVATTGSGVTGSGTGTTGSGSGSGSGTTPGGGGGNTGSGGGDTTTTKTVIQAAPVVTTQPQSVVVTSGQAATFSVTATSESAMSYQWSRSGSPISGATTSNYVMTSTQMADSSARFTVAVTNGGGTTVSDAAVLTVNTPAAQTATPLRPFSDQSPWNSRPTRYTLGTYTVPTSAYYPNVTEGQFSVGAFTAAPTDAPVSVRGLDDSVGIYIADAEIYSSNVTIPHWPANVVPASGSDGHADIVDVAANKIHSFYQLRNVNGVWRAQQYTWTALDGRGFGTQGQYFQGSRAAGVVPMAGLIRTAEIDDGLPSYKHALAMSMTFNALAANPAYAFPATAADVHAASLNSGQIPEGALMMLPADFDLSVIRDPKLLKVARTLQSFGAYVVDANYGTPYIIYVELGSGFQLMPNGWDSEIASELDQIRAALRQVVSATQWVDANGLPFTPTTNLNLLSMRGSWYVLQGSAPGVFDSWTQSLIFPDNGVFTKQLNGSGRSMPPSTWGNPVAGRTYLFTVKGSGGAKVQLDLVDGNQQAQASTGLLGDGQSVMLTWPAGGVVPWLTATSGAAGGGKVSATLVAQ